MALAERVRMPDCGGKAPQKFKTAMAARW